MSIRCVGQTAASMALLWLFGGEAALAQGLSSLNFAHQYNGDVYPLPDYTSGLTFAAGPSSNGSFLSFQTGTGNYGYFRSNSFAGQVSDSTGWSLEFSIKVGTDAASLASGAFEVAATDDSGNLGAFSVGPNYFAWQNSQGVNQVVDTNNNTTGFNTFRIDEIPGGSGTFEMWRDNVLLTSVAGFVNNGNSPGMFFGSGSSSIGGPTIQLDYIRWDATGAYVPLGFLYGDLNNDHIVNLTDYNIMTSEWNQTGKGLTADVNKDGKVDLNDFRLLKNDYIATNGPGADLNQSVPEPRSLVLLAAAIPFWMLLRRDKAR